MATSLARQGYAAQLHEVPGLHDFDAWRDAFNPHLARLLASLWSPR
jgi:enterochelin esterase family protein